MQTFADKVWVMQTCMPKKLPYLAVVYSRLCQRALLLPGQVDMPIGGLCMFIVRTIPG